MIAKGFGISFGSHEMFYNLLWMVVYTCEYTENHWTVHLLVLHK